MFKVIKFELRKLVSRPGIYILAVLLALLLTVSAFAYKPIENKKTYNTLAGETISEINADFINNYQPTYDKMIEDAESVANTIKSKSYYEYEAEVKDLVDNVNHDIDAFVDSSVSLSETDEKLAKVNAIHNVEKTGSLDILNEKLAQMLGKESSSFISIATTQSNYSKINAIIIESRDAIDQILELGSPNDDDFVALARECSNYKKSLNNALDNIKYVDYSDMILAYAIGGNYYKVTIERHDVVLRKMNEIVKKVEENSRLEDSKTLKNDFNELFNEYRLISQNYTTLFDISKKLTVMESFNESEMSNIKFIGKDSYYSLKEQKTRYTYYMEKDTNELNFANALSFDYSSNDKANGFDYTYFALSIFSVVLIVFAIMLASHSIARETKDGTMRFLSIRPVSRTTLYWGKFFYIAIISLIMLVFATIASLIVGGAVFGMSSANILTIINASDIVVIHPSLTIIIFVGSIFLNILVYTSLAIMMSALLKSDLLALILTAGLYVINMLLPLFFGANSWLRFNPFTNINLYAYVGAGTISADSILGKIFSSVVYHGINIWVSLIFVILIIGIANMVGIYSTKRREF